MRLLTRIRQISSQAFSRTPAKATWQRLGRRRRIGSPDPDVGLIRDLIADGTPMSLASLKAALDATASTREAKRSNGLKSLAISAVDGSCSILA